MIFNNLWQTRRLQRYIPEIRAGDLESGPSGVRGQAMGPGGTLEDELLRVGVGGRTLHFLNTPSPAATSSLAIAELISDDVRNHFKL